VTRKPRTPPRPFTDDEIFYYHLLELELIVASGKIGWTADLATAARDRLSKLTAALKLLESQCGNDR
jgi:hypothetical protein